MMLQLGVKTLHLHHHAEIDHISCSDCDNHRVHNGHILSWDGSSSDCVVCQLFTSPFCKASDAHLSAIIVEHRSHAICPVADICNSMQMHNIARAPPVYLL